MVQPPPFWDMSQYTRILADELLCLYIQKTPLPAASPAASLAALMALHDGPARASDEPSSWGSMPAPPPLIALLKGARP